jgi:hypothetical protein
VVRDGDVVVHNVRGFTVKSGVRSATSKASRSDGKRRLETGRPRVSVVRAQLCKNLGDSMHQEMRQREGRGIV